MRSAPVALVLVLLVGVESAQAAFTTDKCLVRKRLAWGALRKCQGAEEVKLLKAKPADFAKCQTQFQLLRVKIDAMATKAAIGCRYGANGDGTVTDYDTGLMWEIKTDEPCHPLPDIGHCLSLKISWTDTPIYIGGIAADGTMLPSFLAGHTDWRLPTILELRGIVDLNASGCQSGGACLDPIFGPTLDDPYWTSTTSAETPGLVLVVRFSDGAFFVSFKTTASAVRAVRSAL